MSAFSAPEHDPRTPVGEGSGGHSAVVIGAGLIGASIGFALHRAGWQVTFDDVDPERQAQATVALTHQGPGSAHRGGEIATTAMSDVTGALDAPALVVVAVTPELTGLIVGEAISRYPYATVIDTASVKSQPAQEIEASGIDTSRVVLSHPLGGRATSGPDDASADLFVGRIWALSRFADTADEHAQRAERAVLDCGAVPYWVSPESHDEALAVTSHLPQLVASGLAAAVADLGRSAAGLSGPALADMTRIADSPIEMWNQIIVSNRGPIAAGLDHLIETLVAVRKALATDDDEAISAATTALLLRGRAGRSLIRNKHAGLGGAAIEEQSAADRWVWVEATLPDAPGRLAAALLAAAAEGINVEDVELDHASHAAAGTVALAVAAEDAPRLRQALAVAFAPDPDENA